MPETWVHSLLVISMPLAVQIRIDNTRMEKQSCLLSQWAFSLLPDGTLPRVEKCLAKEKSFESPRAMRRDLLKKRPFRRLGWWEGTCKRNPKLTGIKLRAALSFCPPPCGYTRSWYVMPIISLLFLNLASFLHHFCQVNSSLSAPVA